MAEVLDQMPKIQRSGRNKKYKLDDLFDKKKPVKLFHGTKKEFVEEKADYDCSTRTMRHNIYRIARKKGLKVETVIDTNGKRETITFNVVGTLPKS